MSKNHFKDYGLSDEIVQALTGLGYTTPTEVQRKVLPPALGKTDLIVRSQTGSGKTAAFGIPISEMVEWEENKPQALILTPTRELAAQVKEDISNIGRYKRIKALALFGRQSFEKQRVELKQKAHVVVGTPGRVLDHIQKGTIRLERLAYFVLDEADEMLNMGFIDQVEAIIQRLPKERTTFTFSATLPDDVEQLCLAYMKNPTHIVIEATGLTTETIEHSLIEVEEEDKIHLLKEVTIVENPDSCIIFCRTQERVEGVFRQLQKDKYPVAKIHGGMVQEDRFDVMNAFKKGAFRYLVATDVAARGIDVEDLSHIINYDLPLEKESYVHRTGRTGRAGKTGKAISFLTPYENKYIDEIEEYVGFEITKIKRPSKEAVERATSTFEKKVKEKPKGKQDRGLKLNEGITKLYFNGGKNKKLRAGDFVGSITQIGGVSVDDIGVITIQEKLTYIDILNGKGSLVLKSMRNMTVKGKQLKVHEANR